MILPADDPRAAAAAAKLADDAFAVIAVLVRSAREGSGWLRRGVRGWHTYREIEALLAGGRPPGSLYPLRRKGLLQALETRDGQVHLYRANDRSARVFDLALDREHTPLVPAARQDTAEERRMLFMPLYSWVALTALRLAKEKGLPQPRRDGQGWLTSSEMKGVLGGKIGVYTEYLYWLERRRLVLKRHLPSRFRPVRPAVIWRATETGERTRVIDDYGLASGLSSLLQVEVADGGPVSLRHGPPLSELLERHDRNVRRRLGLPPEPQPGDETARGG